MDHEADSRSKRDWPHQISLWPLTSAKNRQKKDIGLSAQMGHKGLVFSLSILPFHIHNAKKDESIRRDRRNFKAM